MASGASRAGTGALKGGLNRFRGLGRSRRVAALASAAWAVLVLAYAIGFFAASAARGTAALDLAFFAVTLALPLLLIWLAAFLAEALERQRELVAALAEVVPPLHDALEAVRAGLERHAPASPAAVAAAAREAAREAVEAAARETLGPQAAAAARLEARVEAMLGALEAGAGTGAGTGGRASPGDHGGTQGEVQPGARASAQGGPQAEAQSGPGAGAQARKRRAARPAARGPSAEEPALPHLGDAAEAPLAWADLVRALDFPRDATDEEGFRALKRALGRPSLARMLQAAEDVLTLLSQEGVYMDDLAFSPAEAAAWRRFASGGREGAAGDLGAPEEAGAVETARALMKSDPIFRDTALVFQRRFDAALAGLAEGAGDAELAELADTRSGRAFRLMLRASGAGA